MSFVTDILFAFWDLFAEMAPFLLLGFLLAGLMRVYLPQKNLQKYFGKNNIRSVINAAILGIPLPLCSCGVIPTGISFNKNGASKGATVSFLISTPQTGVDSIAITYALLGWPFAIIRPIAALASGVFGGWLENQKGKTDASKDLIQEQEKIEGNKLTAALKYGFVTFLDDIAKWLMVGLVVAALITVFVPQSLFTQSLTNPILNTFLIIIASIPMYVCATGSVPIAVALMMKGLSPGAAFVFLMAGPATNAGTISVIGNSLGNSTLYRYLFAIIAGSLFTGMFIDYALPSSWFLFQANDALHVHSHMELLNKVSAFVLAGLLMYSFFKRFIKSQSKTQEKTSNQMETLINVEGMTCNHCKASVEKSLSAIKGIKSVDANPSNNTVSVEADGFDEAEIKKNIDELGFTYKGLK